MKRTYSIITAFAMIGMALASSVAAVADTASAHACKERGDPANTGCNAGDCPDDGENHVHIEDVRWWFDDKCCKSGDDTQHDIGDQEEVDCFIGPNGESCYVTREWVFEEGRQMHYDKFYCYDEDGEMTSAGYV